MQNSHGLCALLELLPARERLGVLANWIEVGQVRFGPEGLVRHFRDLCALLELLSAGERLEVLKCCIEAGQVRFGPEGLVSYFMSCVNYLAIACRRAIRSSH